MLTSESSNQQRVPDQQPSRCAVTAERPQSLSRRCGLKDSQRCEDLTRFLAFAILHLTNYFMNLAIVIHVFPAMKEEWGKAGYVVILGFAHALVGIYCVLLAYGDSDIKRCSRECLGCVGHALISLVLGFTQLIQLKVAWGKYTRRQYARRDNELFDEDSDDDCDSATRLEREGRRVAILENIIPWTFPSKCLEGIIEGVAFALVELYVVLKIGWDDDVVINDLFDVEEQPYWYALITASGILSFSTIGVSMLNFDYHLSPAVQKTIDHSLRYTIFHLMYRACEVGSRLTQIIFFVLAFRPCGSTWERTVPYIVLLLDYVVSVVTLFLISAEEERLYPGLASFGGFWKRISCSLSVGLLLFFANLAEFVDVVERGLLRTAAMRFSQLVRTFRCIELILLLIWLSVDTYCHVPMVPPGHEAHPHQIPDKVHFWIYILSRHKIIFAAAALATTGYYMLLFFGFHRLALLQCEELERSHLGRLFSSMLYLPSDPRPDAQPPAPALSAAAAQQEQAFATALLDVGQGGAPAAVAARREAPQQEVRIQHATDADLPRALSDGQPANDTFYHNLNPEVRVRRAPSLSFLLLSRGVHGSVAEGMLATICEDDVMPTDIVTVGTRVNMSDFELLEQLGKGAYAPVWKARKIATNEIFAMKRLVKHNYVRRSAPTYQAQLPKRERDTLFMSGHHQFVAALHYAFETDTYWVLVTEFCELGSLSRYIRQTGRPGQPGLSPEKAARLGGHVLQALGHLHQCFILHRDIKPDNIGISGREDAPIAKLLDFGFAKRADSRQSRTIVGSYGYCAPEIETARHCFGALRQGGSLYDERVDLYSFGVVLMVMIVGREADLNGDCWTHRQLREMLKSPAHPLWTCQRYRNAGINGELSLRLMRDCGAFDTIKKLTETLAEHRPRTAKAAGLLPLFTRHPGSLPETWTDENSLAQFPQEGAGGSFGMNALEQ